MGVTADTQPQPFSKPTPFSQEAEKRPIGNRVRKPPLNSSPIAGFYSLSCLLTLAITACAE